MASIVEGESERIATLSNWFLQNGFGGVGGLEFRDTLDENGHSAGLGCFARWDFKCGDVLFTVPQEYIFSISTGESAPLASDIRKFAIANDKSHLVTAELLIWVEMCRQRYFPGSKFHTYLNSLSATEPTILSWSDDLKDKLSGTNLSQSVLQPILENLRLQSELLTTYLQSLRQKSLKSKFIELCVPAVDIFRLDDLVWARGHYLSRRYPGKFAVNSIGLPRADIEGEKREIGLDNLGSLVPLLDILNHRPSKEWLTFEISSECLSIICNHDIAKVCLISVRFVHIKILIFYNPCRVMRYILTMVSCPTINCYLHMDSRSIIIQVTRLRLQ